jgi:hypothetical protein
VLAAIRNAGRVVRGIHHDAGPRRLPPVPSRCLTSVGLAARSPPASIAGETWWATAQWARSFGIATAGSKVFPSALWAASLLVNATSSGQVWGQKPVGSQKSNLLLSV